MGLLDSPYGKMPLKRNHEVEPGNRDSSRKNAGERRRMEEYRGKRWEDAEHEGDAGKTPKRRSIDNNIVN